jgi:hypothetical protein
MPSVSAPVLSSALSVSSSESDTNKRVRNASYRTCDTAATDSDYFMSESEQEEDDEEETRVAPCYLRGDIGKRPGCTSKYIGVVSNELLISTRVQIVFVYACICLLSKVIHK